MSGTADRGSGLLPPDPFAVVLGFFYPFHAEQRYLASNSFADNVFLLPLFDENLCILLDSVLGFHWLLVPSSHPLCSALMANASFGSLEESVEEVENFSLDDFSLHISPDSAAALKTIESSLVGRLFSRKPLSTGTLRKVLSGMWRLQSGWKFQEVDRKTKTFVFRLSSPAEVKRILNNGPWSPCDGFLMVSAMPEDGVWASADLSSLDIWVKALGVPLPFLTDDSAGKMASRLGKCISVDKVRKNGILVRDFLRFRVRINILCPMIPGISLDDGHMEDVCSGRKRVVLVDDGRSVPLFGPWLRDDSKLENGFALLEVGDIHDIKALEKDDSILGGSASAKGYGGYCSPPPSGVTVDLVVGENGGAPSVRKDILPTGMEGVPRQRSDTAFSVAYNDYVDLQFPTQHVERVAEIFQKHLSPVRFGAGCTNDECVGSRSKSTYQLKRPKLIGPKGIQKKPVFRFSNRDLDLQIGNKRKKVSSISDLEPGFTGESTGNDCIAVLDNHRVPDVFGEGSAVIIEADDNSLSETNFVPKRVCLTGGIEVSEVPLSPSRLGGPPVTSGGELETDSGLLVASAPAVLDGQVKVGDSCVSDARVPLLVHSLRGDSFWSLSLPNSASRFARGVLVSRNLIRHETCWLMADGRNIDVWHSPWIPGLTWEEYKAAFNPRIQQPKVVMLSELCSVRGALDPSLLAGWFLPSVCSTILNIEALPGASQDTLVWRDSPDGSFSVKQAYLSLIKPRLRVSNMEWKKIWASPVQERIKLFLWKMKKNILPCGDRLRSVFGNSSVCVFCKGNNDSLSHLFFHCSLARARWFASPYALRSDLLCFGSDSEIVPWIFSSVCCPFLAPNDNDFPQFAAHLCYSIWHARNQLFHQGIVPSPSSIIEKVMAAINDYNRLLERGRVSVDEPLLEPARTAQPVPKVVNFYVDAAVRGDLAFIAVVVLNEERDFLDALSAKVKCASPLEAECWALCHAFSLCLRMNCEDANFFSDCLPLVSAIRGSTIPSWKLTNMFLHLYSCLNFDVNCCVFWIPRKDNSLAHNVAAWAASHNIVGPLGVGDVAPLVATMD
ncbi:hypothetical protein F8388_000626 [Cannabis sativa]|uniref:Reverse transcriptase zinc-binding domain-containing protein n=1 Tax=Cannabis sativa TaxID=3483 RepID=A0A7J6GGG0_CANSA|nr:hypothetical protein F8388_000626 [Cannabis sativa]